MNGFVKGVAVGAVVAGLAITAAVAANYANTVLANGTDVWQFVTGTNSQMQVENQNTTVGGVVVMTIDPLAGLIPLVTTVAGLPSCVAKLKGAVAIVTDATTPTYGSALSGSSSTIAAAICGGVNTSISWVAH